jgi:hypothetical protein
MRGPSPDVSGAPWAWPLWGAPLDLLLTCCPAIDEMYGRDAPPPLCFRDTRDTPARPGSVGSRLVVCGADECGVMPHTHASRDVRCTIPGKQNL